MATFTSKATGNWSTPGQVTWNETGVPGNGDTVTIATGHTITVDVNTTVGSSPAGGGAGTAAIAMTAPNARLIIGTGITLICRGDLSASGSHVTLNAGAILEFDAQLATTPLSQNYRLNLGTTSSVNGSLTVSGTSVARCQIRSNVLGGNAYIRNQSSTNYNVTAVYCDFTRMGTASLMAIEMGYLDSNFTNCNWDGGGKLEIRQESATNIYRLVNCTMKNTLATACVAPNGTAAALTTGTRLMQSCVFDKLVTFGWRDWTVTDCVFNGSTTGTTAPIGASGANPWASFRNNLVVWNAGSSDANAQGSVTNCYALSNYGVANPHYFQVASALTSLAVTYSGNVFEDAQSRTDGDCIMPTTTAIAQVLTVENNIGLPNASRTGPPGTLVSALGAANGIIDIRHNTWFLGTACTVIGETYAGHAGQLREFRDNLCWDSTVGGGPTAYKLHDSLSTVMDHATVAGIHHNAGYNIKAGSNLKGYNNLDFSSGSPGANDVDGVNPTFVDDTRNSAKWDLVLGGPGTAANAIAELMKKNDADYNSAYAIADLIAWVKAGFVPQAAPMQAASDSVSPSNGWIGALQGLGADTTPPVLSAGSPSGTLAVGTTSTTVSLLTNENATAKWGLVAGVAYASIPNTFTTTGGTSHSMTYSGLTNGQTYTLYVRAQDTAGNPTTTDYTITFSVAAPTAVTYSSLVTRRDEVMRVASRASVILVKPTATAAATPAVYLVKDPDPGDAAVTAATDQGNAKGGQAGKYSWKEFSYDDLGTAYGIEGSPEPPPGGGGEPPGGGGSATVIEASTWRWDGVDGAVLVSSGFPLQPGQVTVSTLNQVRVYVAGVEKAVAVHALDGTFPDGSYRSIGIQFSHTLLSDTPIASEVHVNAGARGTTDLTWVEPTKALHMDNRAVIAPSNPVHLCKTFVTLQPLQPASVDVIGTAWSAKAASSWAGVTATGQNAGTAVYNHCHGQWAQYCRTGNRTHYQWAYDWAIVLPPDVNSPIYSSARGAGAYLASSVALTPGDSACLGNATYNPEGLIGTSNCGGSNEAYSVRALSYASSYWMTGWRQFKRIIQRWAGSWGSRPNAGYATAETNWCHPNYGTRLNWGNGGYTSWAIPGYLTECTTGFPQAGIVDFTYNYTTWLPWILDVLEHWKWNLGDYRDGIVGLRSTAEVGSNGLTGLISMFQLHLTSHELMRYYDLVFPDPRIPIYIKTIADYVIAQTRPANAVQDPGYTAHGVRWVSSYNNIPPAAVADHSFTATTTAGSTTMTYVSGAVPINHVDAIIGVSLTGPGLSATWADWPLTVVGNTITLNHACTVTGTNNYKLAGTGFYTAMFPTTLAWVYAYTGDTTYKTWAERFADPANLLALGTMQTKNWGEYFGQTHGQYYYYINGGAIRGTPGVHPTAIVEPPDHPTLG